MPADRPGSARGCPASAATSPYGRQATPAGASYHARVAFRRMITGSHVIPKKVSMPPVQEEPGPWEPLFGTSGPFSLGLAVTAAGFALKGSPHQWQKIADSGEWSRQVYLSGLHWLDAHRDRKCSEFGDQSAHDAGQSSLVRPDSAYLHPQRPALGPDAAAAAAHLRGGIHENGRPSREASRSPPSPG